MESHLGHSTSTEHEETRRIFFDDPLFEEFALRPLILDGCPLGEVSATASSIEEGDSDGWFREWSAAGDRLAGYGDASAHADHDSTDLTDAEGGASSHTLPLLKQARKTLRPTHPRDPRRDPLLRPQKRLPLAATTEGFPPAWETV
jgi:hypothetical protein